MRYNLKLTEVQNKLYRDYLYYRPDKNCNLYNFCGDVSTLDEESQILVGIAKKQGYLTIYNLTEEEVLYIHEQLKFTFHNRIFSTLRSTSTAYERRIMNGILRKIDRFKTKEFLREIALSSLLSEKH
jgi:hypothetical protein